MALSAGTKLGAYEIVALIGAGCMGEVYRARDTRLKREVAIKVLPDAFANDPERLARFQREAELLATLNHANIAHIHGLEEAGSNRALILELVEGPTLADRIARGPIPLDEALPIAKQIAEALEAAHERGVIHRDLKPANIKLTANGQVKVLDFGLAKIAEGGSVSLEADLSASPTMTSPAMTLHGVVLGTAAYMSPEQARGRPVDRRTDMWAFGCVVYEMLTARRAFGGVDTTETLAEIIKGEPDWTVLPSGTPSSLAKLLRRCLAKDPKVRWPDAALARQELEEASRGDADLALASGDKGARNSMYWRASLVLALLAAAVMSWMLLARPPQRDEVQRLMIPVNTGTLSPTSAPAISPDGTRLVFVVIDVAGSRHLYLRAMNDLEAHPIEGTRNAFNPFFSHDGAWIAFFADSSLKRVAVSGGPVSTIASFATTTSGGTWPSDDTIVVSTGSLGLRKISVSTGAIETLTSVNHAGGERAHGLPAALPGGRSLLFSILTSQNNYNDGKIAALSLDTGRYHVVIERGYHPRYAASGHLVYMLDGNLMAAPFDAKQLAVNGASVPIVPRVQTRVGNLGAATFAISTTGFLVYAERSDDGERALVWVDRQGREEPVVGAPPRTYVYPRISPDGTRAALDVRDQNSDIWIWDFTRSALTNLTVNASRDVYPAWSPDGRQLAFGSSRAGQDNVFVMRADGTGQVERLTEGLIAQVPYGYSPDGQFVLVRQSASETGRDIHVLSIDTRQQRPLIQSTASEENAEISPDGRWVAYESSTAAGRSEIYVRPFPNVDAGRWLVSSAGACCPLWSRDSRELFFMSNPGDGDNALFSVPIARSDAFTAGTPQKLFGGAYAADGNGRSYDISPDGKRFLMIKPHVPANASASALIVVLNWFEELEQRVRTNRD